MPVYNYTTIDDPAQVGFTTWAIGINDAGQFVGQYSNAGGSHAYFYNGSTFITIDDPKATAWSVALGINATGLIVGQYRDTSNHGYIYNPNTGVYSTIDRPGATSTSAFGINAAGQIVGDFSDNIGSGQHGYILTGGVFTTIDVPGAAQGTVTTAINSSGQILGYYYYNNNNNVSSFIYNPSTATYTILNNPLAPHYTFAYGFNDLGQVVGHYLGADGQDHGYVYSGGTYTTIGPAGKP